MFRFESSSRPLVAFEPLMNYAALPAFDLLPRYAIMYLAKSLLYNQGIRRRVWVPLFCTLLEI